MLSMPVCVVYNVMYMYFRELDEETHISSNTVMVHTFTYCLGISCGTNTTYCEMYICVCGTVLHYFVGTRQVNWCFMCFVNAELEIEGVINVDVVVFNVRQSYCARY